MSDLHRERREQFASKLGAGLAILPAAFEQTRNDDVDHEFRQDSAFYFLTGFPEPEAVALIEPDRYTLFVRPRDRELETWNGSRAGIEGAVERYGADEAFPISDFEEVAGERLVGVEHLYYAWGSLLDARMSALLRRLPPLHERFGYSIPYTISDPTPLLDELRLRKTPDEIELLRRAADLSVAGHGEAMRFAQADMYEYQVQASMEWVFRQGGSLRNGYPSIVASGPNATVLHYTENDRQIRRGDLILIDAAAEYGYFSADITRTFPVDGEFSGPQRAIYEVVLDAEQAGIAAAEPGSTMRVIHDVATRVLTEGLVDLGLLPRSVEDSLSMHHYREYFMHRTGHWLGMDVHDAGTYKVGGQHRELEPNMTFTVEPGIYVRPDGDTVRFPLLEYDLDEWTERRIRMGMEKAKAIETEEREKADAVEHTIPEEFRGIGVRIEDDILITAGGHENLTAGLPVQADEVEALCREVSRLS